MKWIYNNLYILKHENLFYIYLGLVVAMIVITGVLVYKELKKSNENK